MSAPEVTIYTGHRCAYCNAAKKMLDSKNVSYHEINIHEDASKAEEMVKRTNRRTVPQIFIGNTHVGGFDDMAELNTEGKLDDMLKGSD
ncbi:MAG: glutaredoxin 3 [Gammaproteobacteria bacterium]